MRTWYFKDGEPVLDAAGNIKVISGLESLIENIDQRLKLFRGKYFLDIEAGVPYLENIMTKPIDPGLISTIVTTEILKEVEVTGVTDVVVGLDPNTRVFTYSATISSVYGNIEVTL